MVGNAINLHGIVRGTKDEVVDIAERILYEKRKAIFEFFFSALGKIECILRGRFGFSLDPLRWVVAVRLVFKWPFSRSLHDGIEVKAEALENVSFISGLLLDP